MKRGSKRGGHLSAHRALEPPSSSFNRFRVLENLEDAFELQPSVFSGGGAAPLSRLLPAPAPSSSMWGLGGAATQGNGGGSVSGLADALPTISLSSSSSSLAAPSFDFSALASGLSQSEAAAREASAARQQQLELQRHAQQQQQQARAVAAVHGRERDEFRAKLAGRTELSAAARRRKATQLKHGESYGDRLKARLGGTGGGVLAKKSRAGGRLGRQHKKR